MTGLSNPVSLSSGGVVDNTSTLQNYISSVASIGGGVVQISAGTYSIGAGGIVVPKAVIIVADSPYAVRFIATQPLKNNMFNLSNADGAGLVNITIDVNGQPTDTYKDTLGNKLIFSPFSMGGCIDSFLDGVHSIGWTLFGSSIGNSIRNKLRHCYFERLGEPSPTQNQAISVGGLNQFLLIDDCTLNGSGADICAQDSEISRLNVYRWGFGGGLTTEQDQRCFRLSIHHCSFHDSAQWVDVNNTALPGIESWADYSDVSHNVMFNCYGDGGDIGGKRCIVTANRAYNNGHAKPVPSASAAGLAGRYDGDSKWTCDGTAFTSNECWDDRGAAGTQGYGLILQLGVKSVVFGGGNNFAGNVLGTAVFNGAQISIGS